MEICVYNVHMTISIYVTNTQHKLIGLLMCHQKEEYEFPPDAVRYVDTTRQMGAVLPLRRLKAYDKFALEERVS